MVHHYKRSLASILSVLLVISFYSSSTLAQSQSAAPTIEYHFPMDGSKYVPSNTPVILRPTVAISASMAAQNLVITGTMTGQHNGNIVLSDDGKTLIFTPTDAFESGEQVTVSLGTGITATNGTSLVPISFSFEVQDNDDPNKSPFLDQTPASMERAATHPLPPTGSHMQTLSDSSINGFDSMFVVIDTNPSPGYIFLSTLNSTAFFKDTGSGGTARMVLDNNGNVVYQHVPLDSIDWDFQPQPNGLMTFFSMKRNKWFAMDSTYTIVDSFWTNAPYPYTTDVHDLELLTNGHALMLSYFPIKPFDLSKYGGSDTATFIGGVIEETDAMKNPVWIWRSWDTGHYLDTDATFDFPSETKPSGNKPGTPFDAVHPNAVSIDTDGNILLSARELDEVSKIDRKTGDFIWRLGGKHNQFKFIDDSIHFSHQHGVRRIANGHITLFDNGNIGHTGTRIEVFITPADSTFDTTMNVIDTMITPADTEYDPIPVITFARACEYDVNTDSMTATLVWYYSDDSSITSQAMGYVQRLPDGNTFITWGLSATGASTGLPAPEVTEVTPDKQITFQMNVGSPFCIYRAFKFPSPTYDPGVVAPAATDTLLPPLAGVSEQTVTANSQQLGAPYPNPSNGSSMVTINAAPSDRLTLALYDPLGRQVRTYFSGIAAASTFSLELITSDLPDGAYELVLRGEGGTVSRQFNILR